MKISCLPVSLFDTICSGGMSVPQWAREAKAIGFDGFDISSMFIQNHTPAYLRPLGEAIAETGMPIAMMTTYPDFTHPDPVQRRREQDYLARDIAVASQLGVEHVRVLAGQAHPEMGVDEGVDLAIQGLHRAAEVADAYGVRLVYEDHAKPGAWDYIDFSYPPELFLRIAQGVRDTSVGINYDTGNITAAGGDTLAVLEQVIDRVVTVHVSDMAEKGTFRPVAIGTGAVPNREIFRRLKQFGFDGWLCIEECSGQGLAGIAQAYRFVRDTWDAV